MNEFTHFAAIGVYSGVHCALSIHDDFGNLVPLGIGETFDAWVHFLASSVTGH